MASSNITDNSLRNLNHIYFFISNDDHLTQSRSTHAHTACTSVSSTQDHSHTCSPGNLQTDVTANTTTKSSSEMNPLAAAFTPRFVSTNNISRASAPTAAQPFEVRKTPSKGFGLFATSNIPLGTLIICEQPLIRITAESVHSAWGPYCRLTSSEKAAFDSLHGYQAEGVSFEKASRTLLMDPSHEFMGDDIIEDLVAEQIRVMKIFSVNHFRLPPGDLSIFAIASRLNHSCIPNVHASYNPTLSSITVYAVNDILPDEELCTTYLGAEGHYTVCSQRLELLRSRYGFTCDCPACTDRTSTSDGRREVMGRIAWGLQQFERGVKSANQFIPTDRLSALKQAEDLITIMLNEGLVTIELTKAYRIASMHALGLQDYEKAVEYARNEAEVEKNCMGTVLDDLKRNGAATECWLRKIFHTIKIEKGEQAVLELGGEVENDKPVKNSKQKARKRKQAQANVMGAQEIEVDGEQGQTSGVLMYGKQTIDGELLR